MIWLSQQKPRAHRAPTGLIRMRRLGALGLLAMLGVLAALYAGNDSSQARLTAPKTRVFLAQGTIQKLEPGQNVIVIAHEAIPAYMEAMTMPFKLRDPEEMHHLQAGDRIRFRLSVNETQSWIDSIVKTGRAGPNPSGAQGRPQIAAGTVPPPRHPLLDYAFTNELGQPVTLHSFAGQALAITFFFTRCPLPEFCPRLSKNFAEASHQLSSLSQAPTNWHFLSISFDPDFDTPNVLRAYAEKYQYDPAHWSFLTGPKDKIAELARLSNVEYEPESGLFNHNFRTMIIDAAGRLQMVFPTGGDLSEEIVDEMLKAAKAGQHKPS